MCKFYTVNCCLLPHKLVGLYYLCRISPNWSGMSLGGREGIGAKDKCQIFLDRQKCIEKETRQHNFFAASAVSKYTEPQVRLSNSTTENYLHINK